MSRKWWTLAGACAGLFLLMLDSTVVALALPAMRKDVGASGEGLQWVMNGYLLAKQMDGDAELYAAVATIQTVVSFFTIPLVLYLTAYAAGA